LVEPKDFFLGRTDAPIRFEIEVELEATTYGYAIAFEFPAGFRELRVLEEKLTVDGKPVYTRELAQVHLAKSGPAKEAKFPIDWHLVALPIVQQESAKDPLSAFKQWLGRMLILRPMPSLIRGDSEQPTLQPNPQVTDFAAWFSGLLASAPSAYSKIDEYLKLVMPDLKDIKNPVVGTDSRRLVVQFSNDQGSVSLPFKDLSDGEKVFHDMRAGACRERCLRPVALLLGRTRQLSGAVRSGHFVLALRTAFQSGGQSSRPPTTPRRSAAFPTRIHLFFSGKAILSLRSYVHSTSSK